VAFEDGSPAITINKYGRGTIVSILSDAPTAARNIPELVRDVLDYAVSLAGDSLLVDVVGSNENSDIAVEKTTKGFRVAVVNYNATEMELTLKPIKTTAGRTLEWLDLETDRKISTEQSLQMKVLGSGYRALEYRVNER
jgi:TusA-related sulfurtransferase